MGSQNQKNKMSDKKLKSNFFTRSLRGIKGIKYLFIESNLSRFPESGIQVHIFLKVKYL